MPYSDSGSPHTRPLDVVLETLVNSAKAVNTRKTYARAWKTITEFLIKYNTAFPMTSLSVARLVSYLFTCSYAPATIQTYISVVAYVHKVNGFPDPTATFIVK